MFAPALWHRIERAADGEALLHAHRVALDLMVHALREPGEVHHVLDAAGHVPPVQA